MGWAGHEEYFKEFLVKNFYFIGTVMDTISVVSRGVTIISSFLKQDDSDCYVENGLLGVKSGGGEIIKKVKGGYCGRAGEPPAEPPGEGGYINM